MVTGFRDNLKTPQTIPYLIPVGLQIARISSRLSAVRLNSHLYYLYAAFVRLGAFVSIWSEKVTWHFGSLLVNLYRLTRTLAERPLRAV